MSATIIKRLNKYKRREIGNENANMSQCKQYVNLDKNMWGPFGIVANVL